MQRGFCIAVGAALVMSSSVAEATVVEGVRFPDRLEVEGRALDLRGVALLRYKLFLKAYVAAFYVDAAASPDAALERIGRRLEIEYFWDIGAADLARATREGIARNVGAGEYAELGERIEQMSDLYRDVEPGDRYSLTYHPGLGTELALNGDQLGVIEGEDFARAIFDIWLGDDPLDASLKSGLLGVS